MRRTEPCQPQPSRKTRTGSAGLQRVTTEAGFFEICALDHLSDFAELLAADPATVTFADVIAAKDALVRALSPSVSAFLLDARYSLQTVVTWALPATVGLMASIEDETTRSRRPASHPVPGRLEHAADQAGRRRRRQAAVVVPAGRRRRVAEYQRYVVRSLVAECARLSLPLVVEPIWYPLPAKTRNRRRGRRPASRGSPASAFEANALGTDMLKVEFPGYVDSQPGRDNAVAACKELDAGVTVPWVILSAGVGYEDFRTQVEIACRAVAWGDPAGRSIWRDAVSTHDPAARDAAVAEGRVRLDELNAITRAHGRPYLAAHSLPDVTEAMPDGWFEHWHPAGSRPRR